MPPSLQPPDVRIAELAHELVKWHRDSRDVNWIWATPSLLSDRVQERLAKEASSLAGPDKEHFQRGLEIASEMRQRLKLDESTSPLGAGPIEQLQARLNNGEVGAQEALRIAGELGASGELSDMYVDILGSLAHSLARRQEWRAAVQFSMMLRTAVRAAGPDSELAATLDALDADWVEIASVALWHVPDARIFADALAAGEAVRKRAHDAKDERVEGRVLNSLGTLHLDPWFANRTSETYLSEHYHWFRRAESDSWDGEPFVLERPAPLPTKEQALETAEKYYREAAKFRGGEALARTLKALAQTLLWRNKLDKKDRKAQIEKVVDQALSVVDPRETPALFAELLFQQSSIDQTRIPDAVEALLNESPDRLVRRFGYDVTLDVYYYIAAALTSVAPARALSLAQDVAHVFAASDDEAVRSRFLRLQVSAFINAAAPGDATKRETPAKSEAQPEPVKELLLAAIKRAEQESWNERQVAAELIRLAQATTMTDEEPLGIDLIGKAEQIAPLTLTPFRDALAHLRAMLLVNCGSIAYHASDLATAAADYAEAIAEYLELRFPKQAGMVLERLADVAPRGGATGAIATLESLTPHAITLQTLLGDDGMVGVRRVCDGAITSLIAGSFNVETLTGLWQLAKGLQFGAFLTSGVGHRFARAKDEATLLDQIAALRPEAAAEPAPGGLWEGEEILLTPYSRSSIRLEGRTAPERLANLEVEFEERIDRQLRALVGNEKSTIIAPEDLRDGITPETVLLDMLEVKDATGKSLLLYALWTREDVSFQAIRLNNMGGAYITVDGVKLVISALSSMTQATRSSLREDPPAGHMISDAATDDLKYVSDVLLMPVWPQLTALAASRGKRHLCIAPHGPLHYLPFHLLLVEGKPLVDYWSVSYLPNTRILLANRGAQTVRRFRKAGPTAVGLSFEGTDDPLLEAVTEARDIAKEGRGSTLLNDQATERAVLDALRASQMVHVATHGAFPSGAAAFQRIFLAPEDDSDGTLYAHELLGRDIRGLSLVTLSACETALGRFDVGDNLRGLPANLFLAGAEAIVGTLWPVETTTAGAFFRAMYRALAQNETRLAAFAYAQREARKAHPEFRDWGAFYYSGAWA
jgi:hypothetical protein